MRSRYLPYQTFSPNKPVGVDKLILDIIHLLSSNEFNLVVDQQNRPVLISCSKHAFIFRTHSTLPIHCLVHFKVLTTCKHKSISREDYMGIHELFMMSETQGEFQEKYSRYLKEKILCKGIEERGKDSLG